MPVVTIPNVGRVTFPDSMSQDDITTSIERDILKREQSDQIVRRPETGGAAGDVGPVMSAGPMLMRPGPAMPQMAQTGEARQAEVQAIPALSAEQAEQVATTPYFKLPPLNDPQMPATSAIVNTGEGLIEQALLTPASPALLTAFKIPGVRQVFTALLGAAATKAGAEKLGEASVTGNRQQAMEGALLGGLGAAGFSDLLPRSAEAVKQIERTPDASSQPKTTAEDGNLRTQPERVVGQMPVEEGGSGVQPQTEGRLPKTPPGTLTPAIQVQGKTFTGEDHLAAYENAKTSGQPDTSGAQEGFVNDKGGFLTREEAAKQTGLPTETEPGKLHSSDLESKPPPSSSETVPQTEAPVEPAVSEASKPGEPPPGEAPAISQATTEGQKTQGDTGPGIIGMGGAASGELPETGAGAEKYGVAARVREERAKAGQVADVPPGKGISAPDSVEHGRELLAAGQNPENALSAFEQTRRLSSDDMALVRAEGERLAQEARKVEAQFGTESPEYKAAWQKLSLWDARSKAMQTEWHKTGQAQQGETDLDTGTFTGLQRAYREETGKDFTPDQAETAKKKAKVVADASGQEAEAKQKLFTYVQERAKSSDAEQAAIDAANKTVINWAAKKAELERRQQVIDANRDLEIAKIEQETEARAKSAADEAVRKAAIKAAKAQKQEAINRAKREKEIAELERKAEQRKVDAANKLIRQRAIKGARAEAKDLEARADLPTYTWKLARDYIEKGMEDWDDIRNKIATDMGLPVEKVTQALAKDKRAKFLADEAWRKQQVARRVKQQAKQWLVDTTVPGYIRALRNIPRIMFSLKVGFHGTVALGTHAPMVAFQPRFWTAYVRDFVKMYRMVGAPTPRGQARGMAYYEMQVQDLQRRPNYITARRAGLVNDPFQYEDYNSPDTTKYVGKLTTMGNRGYSVLKILRQDMFDQMWDQLPKTAKIPEMAKAIADGVNHATGVVKGKAPTGTNLAFFAPRLEASRVMWLAGDPLRAANTFLKWKDADLGERAFALNQLKEKGWTIGTMLGLLALNQGFLAAIGSDQQINVTDPMESDFLRFKVGGMSFAYGSAMVNMAKLPGKLALAIAFRGKMGKAVLEDERVSKVLFDYARSQASPFASVAVDLATGRDYAGRPLPRKLFGALEGDTDIPKRLRLHGITEPYSWTEWASEEFTPIPIEEGLKEVWNAMGMNEGQQEQAMKALLTISVMSATGGRLTEDYKLNR